MVILTLGVDDLSQVSCQVSFVIRIQVRMETGGFEHHVFQTALLHGLEEAVGIFQRAVDRRHGRGDVFSMLQSRHRQTCVTRSIGGNEDRLDVVILDHFFAGGIGFPASAGFRQSGATRWIEVSDRNHLDIRMVLEAELRSKSAQAISGNADPDLPVGKRLPVFRRIRITLILFKTGNDFSCRIFRCLLSSRVADHAEKSTRATHSVQKAPSRHAGSFQVLDQVLALVALSFGIHDSVSFNCLF